MLDLRATKDQQKVINASVIHSTIYRFINWLENFGAISYDQYDFWASSLGQRSKAMYYRQKLLGIFAVAPFVLLDTFLPGTRSFISHRRRFPIADAHYAMGFFALSKAENQPKWIHYGQAYLNALMEEHSKDFNPYCWGYPFDWVTCFGTFKAGIPLMTTIPYIYEAFESGYEITGVSEYLQVMKSTAQFVANNFNEIEIAPGVRACSYTPFDHRKVVNANAYRGFLLTAAGYRFNFPDWQVAGHRNIAFVLHSQFEDGSWLYAMDGKDAFIDNFHTCFVLKNLYKAWRYNQDPEIYQAIHKGFDYYKKHLLNPNGLPLPFGKKQRISFIRRELYDYAEGINICLLLKEFDHDSFDILTGMVKDLLENWILADGHFCTRQLWFGRNTIPYHRWAQSQLFRSLVSCYLEFGK
jgi:hypothetical protein